MKWSASGNVTTRAEGTPISNAFTCAPTRVRRKTPATPTRVPERCAQAFAKPRHLTRQTAEAAARYVRRGNRVCLDSARRRRAVQDKQTAMAPASTYSPTQTIAVAVALPVLRATLAPQGL